MPKFTMVVLIVIAVLVGGLAILTLNARSDISDLKRQITMLETEVLASNVGTNEVLITLLQTQVATIRELDCFRNLALEERFDLQKCLREG